MKPPPTLEQLHATSFGDWTLATGYELWENQRSQDALRGEHVTLGITLSQDEACQWRDSVLHGRGFRSMKVLMGVFQGERVVVVLGMTANPVSVKANVQVTTTTTLTVE